MNTVGGHSFLSGFYQSCTFHYSRECILFFLVLWVIFLQSVFTGIMVSAKPSNHGRVVSIFPDPAFCTNPYNATSTFPGNSISNDPHDAISLNPGYRAAQVNENKIFLHPDNENFRHLEFLASFSSCQTACSEPDPAILPDPETGSIGLTLSGGGAKGFAHIGVLHVIDSLELKIDYISGTSIGAIVGAMYATGYSAEEIEEIAMSVDWQTVFGMRPDLDNVHIDNRRRAGRNVVEFPFNRKGIQFRSGFIQGQHLWSLLEKLFFHVRHIDNFNDFEIPFACVATNIETGEEVVINKGDIVSALRASMAMPAVFEPVTMDDKVLFDGGMVNNFPVDIVKEMGADYVIGVNVSDGLRSADKLQTPLEVVYQMGFIRDALKFRINKEQADIFMEPGLERFTAAGFSHIAEIIEAGRESARQFAASLDSIARSGQHTRTGSIRETDLKKHIVVDSVVFKGIENVRLSFIHNIAGIHPEDTVNADKILRLINSFYATEYFERVTYSYVPSLNESERVNLTFSFSEKPLARISGALHYNSFSGVGIIGRVSATNFLLHNVDAELNVRIGKQPAVRAGVRIFTGSTHKSWINFNGHGEVIDLPLYRNFKSTGEYKNRYYRAETSFNRSTGLNSFFTTGTAIFTNMLEPQILTGFDFKGREKGFEAFARWNKYSLNHHSFSRSGQNLTAEAFYYFNRNYSIDVDSENQNADLPYLAIDADNFFRIKFNWESFIPFNPRFTYFTRLQGGYNYPSSQGIFNMMNIGGDKSFLRNQLTFSGLNEFGIMSSSAFVFAMGSNYNVMSDFYLIPVLNAGLYDFKLNRLEELSTNQLVFGAGLGFGYRSLIGPVKVSFSYSPQTGSLISLVNVGWSF